MTARQPLRTSTEMEFYFLYTFVLPVNAEPVEMSLIR